MQNTSYHQDICKFGFFWLSKSKAAVDVCSNTLRFGVVVDAGLVVLLLAVRGAAGLPVLVAYVVPNGAVVLFQPLLEGSRSLPVPVL